MCIGQSAGSFLPVCWRLPRCWSSECGDGIVASRRSVWTRNRPRDIRRRADAVVDPKNEFSGHNLTPFPAQSTFYTADSRPASLDRLLDVGTFGGAATSLRSALEAMSGP